jgi:HAD superfamily hydrolase (TIGR01662 family)
MKEILLIAGLPAAGKTTLVQEFVSKGYFRINRDSLGGDLNSQVLEVKKAFGNGIMKVVLDNTYVTVEQRAPIIEYAKANKITIGCLFMGTTMEEAQFNVTSRMVKKHGKLLSLNEMKLTKDPGNFPPAALYAAKKNLIRPTITEGFSYVKIAPFIRNANKEYKNKAIIFDYDGTLRTTKSGAKFPTDPNDVIVLPGRKEKLAELKKAGWIILGASNQSGIGKGDLTEETAKACFKRTNDLLGMHIDVKYCPHSVPPIICYCRKPSPGMGVEFIEEHKLNPSECIFVGDMTSDATFAKRCGFQFQSADQFFK